MKCGLGEGLRYMIMSLPARGAWIEIFVERPQALAHLCRSPHGERGLKFRLMADNPGLADRRSPHGERGLKYNKAVVLHFKHQVAPRTGSVD